jgi:predicted transposase YdaD
MRESTTYMEIWEEGEAAGLARGEAAGEVKAERRLILIAGTNRFGEPDVSTRTRIENLNTTQLEALMVKMFKVESWEELLKG